MIGLRIDRIQGQQQIEAEKEIANRFVDIFE